MPVSSKASPRLRPTMSRSISPAIPASPLIPSASTSTSTSTSVLAWVPSSSSSSSSFSPSSFSSTSSSSSSPLPSSADRALFHSSLLNLEDTRKSDPPSLSLPLLSSSPLSLSLESSSSLLPSFDSSPSSSSPLSSTTSSSSLPSSPFSSKSTPLSPFRSVSASTSVDSKATISNTGEISTQSVHGNIIAASADPPTGQSPSYFIPLLTFAPTTVPSSPISTSAFPIASRNSSSTPHRSSSPAGFVPSIQQTTTTPTEAPSSLTLSSNNYSGTTATHIPSLLLSQLKPAGISELSGSMAHRQSCSDLPPTSIIIPPYSRPSSPPLVAKMSSHYKSASTDMRSSVKNRLLRNWIGQNGQQEYKTLERSLARFQQKDRYRIDVLKTNLLPWLRKDQPSLDSLSEASLKTGRLLIMQWWSTLLAVLPDALNTDRSHYFECIIALMTRKEFAEFDRVEDMVSKTPTTPSTVRTFTDGSVTEHTSSTTSVSSSTTLGSGYPFMDSSAFWSSFHQYRKILSQSLQYAIEQLNQKGVFSNVITFCAKVLALCFFKLPGVAFGLLHALPASRSYISRMARALDVSGESCVMPQIMALFPERLSSICFTGTRSWWREFEKQKRKIAIGEVIPPMEMFGNWVRRWQSDDSELFFAFYRHYHICLAQYLEGPLHRSQIGKSETSTVTSKCYAGAPGYLYLSAFFLTKIEGLVHREIHPVTTIVQLEQNAANGNGSSVAERDRTIASVTTGEFPGTAAPPAVKLPNSADAGKDGNNGPTAGKPKVLEMASRRFVETIVAIMVDHGNIYGAMLDIWIKAVVTKTSVYDVESVFCLLDFLDMLIAELETRECIHLYDGDLLTVPNIPGSKNIVFVPIHVQFILSTLHLLLTTSDHTVTLMRTISFIYQNFSLLTGTIQTLEQLILGTLLSPDVFEKCFLHWARNVRLYYMRCLVWRVARIGGGVGILPGWKSWTPHSSIASQQEHQQSNGGMMVSSSISNSEGSPKKKIKEPAPSSECTSIELSMSLIVRNIFEVMESRIDMVKRQYAGELSDVASTRTNENDTESSPPESTPSSPGFKHFPSISTVDPSVRRRSNSDGAVQDGESREKARTLYQLQAHQIHLAHQKLTSSGSNLKEKERCKKTGSRSSLIGRKFRRLSRSDHNTGTPSEALQRTSFLEGDAGLFDPITSNKRTSTGSVPITAGNFFRWMFSGGNSPMNNKLSGSGSCPGIYNDAALSKNDALLLGSNHSSSTMLINSHDQSSDMQRYKRGSRVYAGQQPAPHVCFGLESRKYPEHLATYAGRSIPEHTAVLNEYVDWLAQCHACGIKSRPNYATNGGGPVQSLPGGVPGIGLGSSNTGGADEILGDFSVFSLSMSSVVDVSTVVGLPDEWISPGMAQMMMARFPGLVVEWPKFWNNSREASGPPPGPITTLDAMAVVNNPAFSLGKGNVSGVGGGASAGAGGPFGGINLNGSTGNGPSSLRHQQQAQMHHQQQMQLSSRNAAAAAAAAMAASSAAFTNVPDSQDTQGNVMSMIPIATVDTSTAVDPVTTFVDENRY